MMGIVDEIVGFVPDLGSSISSSDVEMVTEGMGMGPPQWIWIVCRNMVVVVVMDLHVVVVHVVVMVRNSHVTIVASLDM